MQKPFPPLLCLALALMLSGDLLKNHESFHQSIAANAELVSKPSQKASTSYSLEGPAWFAEYHRLIRCRPGESEPAYEAAYRYKAFQKSREGTTGRLRSGPLDWIERGPANVGGRTRSIWVDPRDTTHLSWFVGSVGGGVWKTENGGESWRHLTEDLSNLATSVITGSVANPAVLYVGTGEGYSEHLDIMGNGIWKSTDFGETWLPLASTLDHPKFGHTMRIVVDPLDENNLVVASRLGRVREPDMVAARSFIHRSTDGGQSWQETWQDSLIVQQLVAHPYNFDTLFAAVHSRGVLRSFDGGLSWHSALDIQATSIERIEMAISPSDPRHLYFAADTKEYQSLLFYSDDGGDNWLEVRGKDQQHDFGHWLGGQGWYDNTIAVHPFDPLTVFVGGQGAILKIRVLDAVSPHPDGSLKGTMEPIVDGLAQYSFQFNTSTKGVHVDHHALVLIPIDEDDQQFYLLNANDGGIAFSTDGGHTFKQTGDTFNPDGLYTTLQGYNTAQFYGVDKMNGADRYVGGTQDNGTWFSAVAPQSDSSWAAAPTGDGFESAWHYREPDKILGSSQFNSVFRTVNGGASWSNVSPPRINPFEAPFMTRIANSKMDPDLVFCVTKLGVARSFDFAKTWEIVSTPPEWQYHPISNIIRISLADPQIVWTGLGVSEGQPMLVSADGGSTFTATPIYEAVELGLLSGLTTHPFDRETAYALFSAAASPKILRTTDLGQHWEDLSGFDNNATESSNGFPDVAVYSLLVMPFDTNQIWVGTEIGLFESLDGGLHWEYADNGLPAVSIWDMKIVNDQVVVASHGRGVWTVALPELAGYEPPSAVALAPLLEVRDNGLDGRLAGSYTLRSDFDSVFIEATAPINETEYAYQRFQMEGSSMHSEENFHLKLEGLSRDTIVPALVSVIGYKQGQQVKNAKASLVFGVEDTAQVIYHNDFDRGQYDFARLDFNIYQEAGFSNKALHSLHPYLGFNQTYLAVLTIPIIVSPDYAWLTFEEIAMIEPGEPGSVYGDFGFWDFVAVEGTRNEGQRWEIIEAYDSRWSNQWLNNYVEGSGPVDPALIEEHSLNLASTFNPGDTVFLRFRLQSDPYTEGWGWVIDNLSIQDNPTSANAIDLAEELNFTLFPNPVKNSLQLSYRLDEKQAVKIDLFSIAGEFVSTLEQQLQAAGVHQSQFDASQLPPGIYSFRFQVGQKIGTLRWIKA